MGFDRWIARSRQPPALQSNYRAAPTVYARLLISPRAESTAFKGFLQLGRPEEPNPLRILGVVEADYPMVKCFRWALRVCNTVAKIDDFNAFSNIFESHRHNTPPGTADFAEYLQDRTDGEEKPWPDWRGISEILRPNWPCFK